MSLKIYNGYIIEKEMSILELNKRMIELREKYHEKILEEYRQLFFNQLYFYEDLYIIDPEKCKEEFRGHGLSGCINEENSKKSIAVNVLFILNNKISEAIKEKKNNSYNLSASLQIFPLEDKILLLSFGNSIVDDLLEEKTDIKDYHYQNQTDKPDHITDEEWKQRHKDWETAMPSWIPGKTGFSIDLFYDLDLPITLKELFTNKPCEVYKKSLEKRAERLVESLYSYPGFNGTNWSIFMSKEYKEWRKEKSKELIIQLKETEDPLKSIYLKYK